MKSGDHPELWLFKVFRTTMQIFQGVEDLHGLLDGCLFRH